MPAYNTAHQRQPGCPAHCLTAIATAACGLAPLPNIENNKSSNHRSTFEQMTTVEKGSTMKTISNVVLSLAINGAIVSVIVWGIDKYKANQLVLINKNPGYTECTIIEINTYKSDYIKVEYFVNGKRYTHKQGFADKDESKMGNGEKLMIKYSKDDPSVAIIE